MRKLVTSRLFRCILCLILVCCLLVSWSPIRARAVAVEGAVVTGTGVVLELLPVAAATPLWVYVVGLIIVGLGIVGAASAINLANEFVDYSGNAEALLYYNADGTFSYGVDMSFVELVRTFLWEKGFLVNNSTLKLDANVYPPAWALAEAGNAAFAELVYSTLSDGSGLSWDLVYSNEAPILVTPYDTSTGKGVVIRLQSSSAVGYLCTPAYDTFNKFTGTASQSSRRFITSTQSFGTSIVPEIVTTVEGAQLGQVAPQEVPMPDGYPEWHANSLPAKNNQTEEEIQILPIPVTPGSTTIPDNIMQPDIWQGSIADPMPDTGTDTDPEGGTSGDAPSTNIGDYQIDLKQFFPFCIPFDLYDFFTCLNADPVAPVIEWVIPLPGGGTYPLEIDLSAFDGVAQLLRRLQLLLFCVGLAFKTRDLIKG